MADILAGCEGDVNAATAKLLELNDEAQAHAMVEAMQEAHELSVAPAKVRALPPEHLPRRASAAQERCIVSCC